MNDPNSELPILTPTTLTALLLEHHAVNALLVHLQAAGDASAPVRDVARKHMEAEVQLRAFFDAGKRDIDRAVREGRIPKEKVEEWYRQAREKEQGRL